MCLYSPPSHLHPARTQDAEGGGLILSEMSADEVAHGVSKVV